MRAVYVVNRLKEELPKFTDDFSTILSVSSLTRSSTTITCTTSTAHGLTTGNYVTIRGAKEPIALSTITFSNGIATATSSTDHKLSDPSLFSLENLPLYVEISGATGFTGTWELVSVPTNLTFKFKVSGSPSNVSGGFLLLQDQDGYNGYKQITVTSTTAFTYATTGTMQSPAQGTIQVSCLTRIDYAATAQRIQDYYSANASGILETWAFVVMGKNQGFKNDTAVGDSSSAKRTNESYWYTLQQAFSVYVVIPSTTSTLGGNTADIAKSYLQPMIKSLSNFIFKSDFNEAQTQPCVFADDEGDDYIEATYTHRFDFSVQSIVQTIDTANFSNGRPLQVIDGVFNQGLDYYVNTRS
jgi:hypothetical protein